MRLTTVAQKLDNAGRFGLCAFMLFIVTPIFIVTQIDVRPMAAQSKRTAAAAGLPLPDPGYELYYHDNGPSANAATRWGYHDGWEDGRHDRNRGRIAKASTKDHYASAPNHGLHEGMERDSYKRLYREAYVRGYERSSRM
jgi:hypothetical protein